MPTKDSRGNKSCNLLLSPSLNSGTGLGLFGLEMVHWDVNLGSWAARRDCSNAINIYLKIN